MEFKDRLKRARQHAGINQGELAQRVGIKQTSISDLERGKSKSTSFIAQIAHVLGVNPMWLANGEGEMLEQNAQPSPMVGTATASGTSAVERPKLFGRVPIISWVQAGSWTDSTGAVDLAEAEYCPRPPGCSEHTFALRVVGESMIDEYPPGVLIFVDPIVEPLSGDDVVVQCEEHGGAEATFKRYVIEPGSGPMLKALNNHWRQRYFDLTPDCRVVGVVMAQMRIRKR